MASWRPARGWRALLLTAPTPPVGLCVAGAYYLYAPMRVPPPASAGGGLAAGSEDWGGVRGWGEAAARVGVA